MAHRHAPDRPRPSDPEHRYQAAEGNRPKADRRRQFHAGLFEDALHPFPLSRAGRQGSERRDLCRSNVQQ